MNITALVVAIVVCAAIIAILSWKLIEARFAVNVLYTAGNVMRAELEKNRWIPICAGCQMPEEDQDVLVTVVVRSERRYEVDVGEYRERPDLPQCVNALDGRGCFDTFTDWTEGSDSVAIAWMPKPKAYEK